MNSVSPRLLISVRNADEARAARRGLAGIIDVKEPLRGSLGRADAAVIGDIHRAISEPRFAASVNDPVSIPSEVDGRSQQSACLSLALGEVAEWHGDDRTLVEEYLAVIREVRPQYLKLGLAGLTNPLAPASLEKTDWQQAWTTVRTLFPGDHEWVAVAYADSERAASPSPNEVCEAAIASQCRVLLLDTFLKDTTTLLDWQSAADLRELRRKTQQHGMLLAMAGRVSREVALQLLPLAPDIIGVRGAVCVGGQRTSTIDAQRIDELRAVLCGVS